MSTGYDAGWAFSEYTCDVQNSLDVDSLDSHEVNSVNTSPRAHPILASTSLASASFLPITGVEATFEHSLGLGRFIHAAEQVPDATGAGTCHCELRLQDPTL